MEDNLFENLSVIEKAELLTKKINEIKPGLAGNFYSLYGHSLIQEDVNVTDFMDALGVMEVFCLKVLDSSLVYLVGEMEAAKVLNLFSAVFSSDFMKISADEIAMMKPICKELSKEMVGKDMILAKKIKAAYKNFFKKLPVGV